MWTHIHRAIPRIFPPDSGPILLVQSNSQAESPLIYKPKHDLYTTWTVWTQQNICSIASVSLGSQCWEYNLVGIPSFTALRQPTNISAAVFTGFNLHRLDIIVTAISKSAIKSFPREKVANQESVRNISETSPKTLNPRERQFRVLALNQQVLPLQKDCQCGRIRT